MRKTHEQFVNELSLVNPYVEVIGEYISARDHILVKCTIHDHQYYSTPDNLLRGKGCRLCANIKIANKKRKDFSDVVRAFYDRKVILLSSESEITSLSKDRLRYICPVHGEQTILWNNFCNGAGCRKCADEENGIRMRRDTWNKIQDYFKNSEYKLVSCFDEYVGAKDSCLRCMCEKHGEFKISWNNLNKFEGCPVCNSSAGERKIFHFLRGNGVQFERSYRFNDLVGLGGKKLSYDFYLPNYNILIEYQGQQHEAPASFNGMGEDVAKINFEKQKEHDKRKRDYAHEHGYNLLEIWYYDFNRLEDIINQHLSL